MQQSQRRYVVRGADIISPNTDLGALEGQAHIHKRHHQLVSHEWDSFQISKQSSGQQAIGKQMRIWL